MRTLTIEQTVYNYSDLLLPENKALKKKVLEKHYDINVNHEWYDFIYEDFKTEIAPKFGFEVDKMYFSGFSSQVDGAMFEGSVTDFTKFVSDVRIKKLIEKRDIYFDINFKHYGHYYHERSYKHTFEICNLLDTHDNISNYCYNLEEVVTNTYENLCKELYQNLEKAYDYLTSDETILETIASNEYEFDENGNII
jgi:hypothetical protein